MIKKLTISSLIITVILGVCALLLIPFAVKNEISLFEKDYIKYYNFDTQQNIPVNGVKNLNISSHQRNKIWGHVYQTNDKEIRIYYRGFSLATPKIIHQVEGDTLNLEVELEHLKDQQKNFFSIFLNENLSLNIDIYVPKDINITLYCDNLYPSSSNIIDATEIMDANGEVYGEETIPTASEFYSTLKVDYGIIDNGTNVPYTSLFEKLNYIMKDACSDYHYERIERPLFLGVKDIIANDMISSFKSYLAQNPDIYSTQDAKDKIITCATTYINAQTRLAVIVLEEDMWFRDWNNEYYQDEYPEEMSSAITQLNQAKTDFSNSIITSLQSRKTEIINMLTFI